MKNKKRDKKYDFRVKLVPDENKYVVTCTMDKTTLYITKITPYKANASPRGEKMKYHQGSYIRAANWIKFLTHAKRFDSPQHAINYIHKVLYPYHYPEDENKFLDTVWDEDTGYHPNAPEETPKPEFMPDDAFYNKLISYLANAANGKQIELEHAIAEVIHHHMERTGMYEKIAEQGKS